MAESTGISWTDSTFNPWHGCSKVGPGCDNCYAERDSKRFNGNKTLWGVNADRLTLSDNYWNQPIKWNKRAGELGYRHKVFCASMADVFDKNSPEGARERLWELIKATPNLDWLILTKRIGNAKTMLPSDWGNGYKNVWLMITVVNQTEADRDIPKLLETPAAVHGLSMEPLLGYVKIPQWFIRDERYADPRIVKNKIGWVITGGESGPNSRPMHESWVKYIHHQCKENNVPFFFKQWGEYVSSSQSPIDAELNYDNYSSGGWLSKDGTFRTDENPNQVTIDHSYVFKLGKKSAGNFLDGSVHENFPYKETKLGANS